jgi:hypothetical protein
VLFLPAYYLTKGLGKLIEQNLVRRRSFVTLNEKLTETRRWEKSWNDRSGNYYRICMHYCALPLPPGVDRADKKGFMVKLGICLSFILPIKILVVQILRRWPRIKSARNFRQQPLRNQGCLSPNTISNYCMLAASSLILGWCRKFQPFYSQPWFFLLLFFIKKKK